jgi:hypothetical protein
MLYDPNRPPLPLTTYIGARYFPITFRLVVGLSSLLLGGDGLLAAVAVLRVGGIGVRTGTGGGIARAVGGHPRWLLYVYPVGQLGQVLLLLPQSPEPLPRQHRSASRRFVPHDWEIRPAAEVLCDGDRRVEVQDDVPPPSGNEDGLARLLQDLDGLAVARPRWLFCFRVNKVKPSYCLVPLLAAHRSRYF